MKATGLVQGEILNACGRLLTTVGLSYLALTNLPPEERDESCRSPIKDSHEAFFL
jgi:hypothetical protein